jgi:hypothetical protein
MSGIGLWRIKDAAPSRLSISSVGLEQHLEAWIERDPSLLEHGLTIVGRQLRTEAGPLDLLAIDPQGRWVLIEIKRDRLRREVLAQAIDYASCLHGLDSETLRRHCDAYLNGRGHGDLASVLQQRGRTLDDDEDLELVIYLVGTGIDPGLERMVAFLGDNAKFEIRVVTFSVFGEEETGLMLAREIHEQVSVEAAATRRGGGDRVPSAEELLERADRHGSGHIARPIIEAAEEVGLYLRRYSRSVTVGPPQMKTRMLMYLPLDYPERVGPDRKQPISISAEAFEEFFGIPAARVTEALGFNGENRVDEAGARRIVEGLRELLGGE